MMVNGIILAQAVCQAFDRMLRGGNREVGERQDLLDGKFDWPVDHMIVDLAFFMTNDKLLNYGWKTIVFKKNEVPLVDEV